MNIALTRVDSRLVHGQVVTSWVPATDASVIVVANDAVARDAWRASIMKACVPDEITVQVTRIDALSTMLEATRWNRQIAILLFATIQDAFAAHELGVPFSQLNLGNVHEHAGSREVSPTVFLNDEDVSDLRKLQAQGIEIEIRAVSRDKPVSAGCFLR